MNTTTYEGKVINGRIELPADAILPENSRVLVLEGAERALGPIASPHLANQEQAVDFVMRCRFNGNALAASHIDK